MTLPYVISGTVLSPLPFVLLALYGLWRWPRRGRLVATASLLALAALATPMAGRALLRSLEPPALAETDLAGAQAIVILSAGRVRGTPEWREGETVDDATLARVRYGAKLARRTGLPVLVTGGGPGGGRPSMAALMAGVLRDELGVPVRWVEGEAGTTAENAHYSLPLLRQAGVRRVLLVTSAWHMQRSLRAFAPTGLDLVAAPTDYMGGEPPHWYDVLPSHLGLRASAYALREWAGLVYYALRAAAASGASRPTQRA